MTEEPEAALTPPEVLAAADHLIGAFRATDAAAYFAAFHEQASFAFHTEPAVLPDRATYEELWRGWTDAGWRVISCESADRLITIVGDTAIFTHTVRTTTEQDGLQSSTVERESIVFTRVEGRLVAVHEHLSIVPEVTA